MHSVHLRGVDAEDAIAAIEQRLEHEGFELLDGEDAPPDDGPDLRRITVYEDEATGWVGIADDPQAQTNWGELLAYALEVPVFTLEDGKVVQNHGEGGDPTGIPRPNFSINDDEDDAYAILTFRYLGDESQPDLGAFESELGNLAALLGGGGATGANMEMGALVKQMTEQLMQHMTAGAQLEPEGDDDENDDEPKKD